MADFEKFKKFLSRNASPGRRIKFWDADTKMSPPYWADFPDAPKDVVHLKVGEDIASRPAAGPKERVR